MTSKGNQNNIDERVFRDLNALTETSFPKKCSNCGLIYETSEDFLDKTRAMPSQSGLKSGEDEDGAPIVELFRNCVCGSTLMEFYQSRRDMSEAGMKRRKLFGKLMNMLEKKGMSSQTAREELLKVLRGQHSELLKDLGLRFR